MKTRFSAFFFLLFGLTLVGAACSSSGDGGVFVSEDEGVTWSQQAYVGQSGRKTVTISSVDIQDIIPDPQHQNILYLATKADGIYKTETYGQQWSQLPLRPERIRDLAVDPIQTNNLYTVRENTIIKSVDAGATWEIVYTDSQEAIITRIEVDWFNPDTIFASTSIGTVLQSQDAGMTWRVIFQVDEPIVGLEMDPTDSRVLYIIELDKALHKTTDRGATWTNLMTEELTKQYRDAGGIKQFSIDPNNSQRLYMSSKYGLLRSVDGGQTWETVKTLIENRDSKNDAIRNIRVMPGESNVLFFTVERLIHKSLDGGVTWETIESFPSQRRITDLLIDPKQPDHLYAGVEQVEEKRRGFISQ